MMDPGQDPREGISFCIELIVIMVGGYGSMNVLTFIVLGNYSNISTMKLSQLQCTVSLLPCLKTTNTLLLLPLTQIPKT